MGEEQPAPLLAGKDDTAQLTYQLMMSNQTITTLQTQNAQMAYQLMMIQQGGEA